MFIFSWRKVIIALNLLVLYSFQWAIYRNNQITKKQQQLKQRNWSCAIRSNIVSLFFKTILSQRIFLLLVTWTFSHLNFYVRGFFFQLWPLMKCKKTKHFFKRNEENKKFQKSNTFFHHLVNALLKINLKPGISFWNS